MFSLKQAGLSRYMFFFYKHMKFPNQARLCLAVSGVTRGLTQRGGKLG